MMLAKKYLAVLLVGGMAVFSSCSLSKMVKMAKDQELTVTPSPLEVHADTVAFEMSALLPTKMLKKDKTYTLKVNYDYGDQSESLGEMVFKAADYPDQKEKQPKVSKSFSFPYKPEYKNGDLVIQGIAANQNGKTKETAELPIAKGVITTSKNTQPVYIVSYADRGYTKAEELEPTNVAFQFEKGSSKLRTTEKRGDNGKFLNAFIAKKNVTRTVTVTGSHSPEGAERINSKLAEERPKAIEDFYRGEMKRYSYRKGTSDSIKFAIKPVVEDWTMFKKEMEKTDKLDQNQKNEVMAIINGSGTFEDKEDRLHELKYYNSILMKEIYPKLRTAKTEIMTVIPKKSDAEISILAKGISEGRYKADTLNAKELSYAGTMTPDLMEREKIYMAATKSDDGWQSHNNLAATYLDMAVKEMDKSKKMDYVDKAMNHLQIAKKKQLSAEVSANMAMAKMMKGEGNTYEALGEINAALGMNPSNKVKEGINGMKGVLLIHAGRYQDAINTFDKATATPKVKYNQSLAYLLNKNYPKAMSGFEETIQMDGQDAWAHYGAAITAARMDNQSATFDHLKMAADMNSELKSKAVSDLEFMKYYDTQEFKNALK